MRGFSATAEVTFIFTFTFIFGAGDLIHPALGPIHSGPMRIPDVTKGKGYENISEVLANCERVAVFTLRNSSKFELHEVCSK